MSEKKRGMRQGLATYGDEGFSLYLRKSSEAHRMSRYLAGQHSAFRLLLSSRVVPDLSSIHIDRWRTARSRSELRIIYYVLSVRSGSAHLPIADLSDRAISIGSVSEIFLCLFTSAAFATLREVVASHASIRRYSGNTRPSTGIPAR